MKTTINILIFGLCLTSLSCGQTSTNEVNSNKEYRDTTNNIKNSNYTTTTTSTDKNFDYIIYGRFCGECGGECATMYKFDILNNKLSADHTDGFWEYERGKPITFTTEIHDEKKLLLARQILDSIPVIILSTKKSKEKYGCPDCSDGCGIFLETKRDTIIKKFYIDYQTTELTGEIKIFADYLRKVL